MELLNEPIATHELISECEQTQSKGRLEESPMQTEDNTLEIALELAPSERAHRPEFYPC
jgi:hypothetical protein